MALPAAASRRSLGDYRLLVELGKSHLGALWATRGPGDSIFFLRRLPTSGLEGPALERLRAAALRDAELAHPNIGRVKEVLQAGDELVIASEFVQGELLRSLLRLSNFLRRPFPPRVALQIAKDLLAALAYLHSRGADDLGCVGPDNVTVGQHGSSLILESIYARQAQREGIGSESVDAVAYQPPESLAETKGGAPEMFSVGILLWEMLTGGRRLFAGATRQAVLQRMQAADIADLSGFKLPGGQVIPAEVSLLVSRALNRDLAQRFGSYSEMSAAIEVLLGSGGRDAVAGFLKEVAGNSLAAREKLMGRSGDEQKSLSPTPPPAIVAEPVPVLQVLPARVSATSGAPPVPTHKRRTLLGLAPPKPADVLRASQIVAHPELEPVEPSIAGGPPVEAASPPESTAHIAAELLDALGKEPSSAVASAAPLAAPPPALQTAKEEEATEPLSPERVAEIVTHVPAEGAFSASETEITAVDAVPADHAMLGSLVRELLNASPNEEGHTEPTKLSIGVPLPVVAKARSRGVLWTALGAGVVGLLLAGWFVLSRRASPKPQLAAVTVTARPPVVKKATAKAPPRSATTPPVATVLALSRPKIAPPAPLKKPAAAPKPPLRTAPAPPKKPAAAPKPKPPLRTAPAPRPKPRSQPAPKANYIPSGI